MDDPVKNLYDICRTPEKTVLYQWTISSSLSVAFLSKKLSMKLMLFQCCFHFCLIALDYVGGVPYEILKPVLEKATPSQLYDIEDSNPVSMGSYGLF